MIHADLSTGSRDTALAAGAASATAGTSARGPDLRRRSWGGTLRVFALLAKLTARSKLAFGLRTTTALLGANLLGYSIFMLVWLDVIRSQRGESMAQEFLRGYLLAALALNTTFTLGVEARCWQRISRGLIGVELLRPIGFQPNQLAQAVGDVLVNVAYAAPAYALGWWWVGGTSLFQTEHPFSTLASIVLALLIHFGISYIFVLIGLVTHSSYGLMNTRLALHQALSGFVAPLSMFPKPLREVADCLPFRHAVETPLLIALRGVPSEAVADLLIQQAAWAVTLLGFGAAFFQRAMQWEQHDGG